jgi:hypothetical protein
VLNWLRKPSEFRPIELSAFDEDLIYKLKGLYSKYYAGLILKNIFKRSAMYDCYINNKNQYGGEI